MFIKDSLSITFINPPHADWIIPNFATWYYMKSHYNNFGKYKDKVKWLNPPYRFNVYKSIDDIYSEIEESDIVLFSSYFWNYDICDELALTIRKNDNKKINIIGGPHIGLIDGSFANRSHLYDYVCQPTKPGEVFIEDFINQWFEKMDMPNPEDIAFEYRSDIKKKYLFLERSVYKEHESHLREMSQYANENNLEKFCIIETTRGCPYSCTFCEWGGGIGIKVIKKDIDVVKDDLIALKNSGYNSVFLNDANFGMFEDRDLEIYKFAWDNKIPLTDLSTVKAKNLDRRIRLIDRCFEIIGKNKVDTGYPTVSIQSCSDKAMEIAKRIDLSFDEKITLAKHIFQKYKDGYISTPTLELIMGMPGSTTDDFYNEFNLLWNFQSWNSYRHDYMFLPDAEISREEYLKKYDIKLVEVYSDLVDEDSVDNINSFYSKRRSYFKTISSCFSFTTDEMCEMFFMNQAGNWLLQKMYPTMSDLFTPSEFCKNCYAVIKNIDGFSIMYKDIKEIYSDSSEIKNIKRIGNKKRNESIVEFLEKNKLLIINGLFERWN